MSKAFTAIPNVPLSAACSFIHPPSLPEVVHLTDPAFTIMTDFKNCRPITIGPSAPLSEAALEMKVCNVHMLLVVDNSPKVVGMITTEDLLGEKPLKAAMNRQIKRSELMVRMVMTQQDKIAAFQMEDLKHAKIGDIVEALHNLQQHYGLVVEPRENNGEQRIRGLFSLWEISRRIGEDLTYHISEAHSLIELQRDLDN